MLEQKKTNQQKYFQSISILMLFLPGKLNDILITLAFYSLFITRYSNTVVAMESYCQCYFVFIFMPHLMIFYGYKFYDHNQNNFIYFETISLTGNYLSSLLCLQLALVSKIGISVALKIGKAKRLFITVLMIFFNILNV